ncbi:MAG TPA: EAL domain-containing protein [Clostridia bacterium]|nr:EAL domain-containing protein [Clostridia bacterium]
MTGNRTERSLEDDSSPQDSITKRLFYLGTSGVKSLPFKVTAIYLIFGAIWILLTDKIVGMEVQSKQMITVLSMIKGWVYVGVSGILIYWLCYTSLKKISAMDDNLTHSYQKLSAANNELKITYKRLNDSQEELKKHYNTLWENQKKLKESEERFRLISEAANDAIWEEINGTRYFSARWYEMTGYSKQEIEEIGGWDKFIHPSDKPDIHKLIESNRNGDSSSYQYILRYKVKSDHYEWLQVREKVLLNEKGEVYHSAGSCTNITALKEYEHKLRHLAYNDHLTGLLNRTSLNERLNTLISENKHKSFVLLFVDVDNFKYINDTIGHSFGDMLLVKISNRLAMHQSTDITVYRIGGDEFLILAEGYEKKDEIEKLAVTILKDFKASLEIENSRLFVSVSIGISCYPEHGKNMDMLLKNADIALYKAKESGRNRIVFYNEAMNEGVSERLFIEMHLRTALENGEFELYYQPQLDMETNKISGFEALLRWKNPVLGFVPPNKFIGIAEENRLILPIGDWVLQNACIFLKKLSEKGFNNIGISINVSIHQLLQDDFADNVIEIIKSNGLDPRQIELEITESILMESYEVIAGKLKLLRARGLRIALDDFGKGYSSLTYLKQLPITTLKIDKSFIDTISGSKKDKSLTDLIVRIGRSMELCVVAEGVETAEQAEYLYKHKCSRIQGYLFSKPVSEGDVFHNIEGNWLNNITA